MKMIARMMGIMDLISGFFLIVASEHFGEFWSPFFVLLGIGMIVKFLVSIV